ncbi:Four helix bundle sensory module for signal transduction [Flavobacterium fluvii]|uniref:Four helix bundle sensory module for signal transduction n=1 Tax=Flavobacterium fluvii TaxID=468056 RepID=A0A1M5NKQ1_9FLAO|nr:MCP four helix bundle domain-containing protein [Flavobacterium fluvii]SHG90088.1 Four helix bundle sensory module for signal transduction [Flavobacterium fluvii]
MKDLKKYSNKTKAAFVLLIVMLIILLSNFNTLQNSKKTNENINAIHKDRLVVARYIFQYANALHSIKANTLETALDDAQKKEKIKTAIQNIQSIDRLYLETVLTTKEKTSFTAFQAACSTIDQHSQNNNWIQARQSSNQALQTLELLSQIQIKESQLKLEQSNSLHKGNTLWGELQIALLVILGGCALYLLMVKKKKIFVKVPESPSLN